jgi:hypothetical protein
MKVPALSMAYSTFLDYAAGNYYSQIRELLKSKMVGVVVHACNPSTGRWRKKDGEFQATMGYVVRPCLKKKKKKK